MAFVAWFDELAKTDVKIAGGKGANLGELTKSGFPVPPGFVVTADAYSEFLDRTNLREKIFKILKETNVDNTKALSDASDKIRKIIIEAKMPDEIRNSIIDSYKQLSKKLNKNEEFVAIRSSATFEDLPSASFAGQQESYLNIKGPDYVAENVQKCWASLFTPRAIFYREKHKFDHSKVNIAVVVQKMVEAEKAGVIFTVHPATGEQDKIVIESAWGLGESVVSGSTTPDRFVVWKATKEVAERDISRKEVMRTKDPKTGKTVEAIVPKEKQKISTLSELEISRLAELAEKVELHYSFPQDIEWAVEGGEIYLLQSRPVTVLYEKKEVKPTVERKAILRGLPASPGITSGPARLIPSVSEISRVKSGDILVTKMTAPDWVSAMSRASAIVTEDGGMTCVTGETKVLTDKGFCEIHDIYNNFINGQTINVLSVDPVSFKTKWKRVINAIKRKANVWTILVSQTGRSKKNLLRITPNHKMITFENGKLIVKPLKELIKNNEKVCIVDRVPALFSYNGGIESSPEYAYLCGSLFSDGYIRLTHNSQGGEVKFTQMETKNKQAFITEVKQKFLKLFNLNLKKYRYNKAGDFICYRKAPALELLNIKKNIIHWLFGLSEKATLNFLAGIIDGDGTTDKRKSLIMISCGEEKTLQAITFACLRLGILPKIRKIHPWFNIEIPEKVNLFIDNTKRLRNVKKGRSQGTKLFAAKQILSDFVHIKGKNANWIRDRVKRDLLIDIHKALQYLPESVPDRKKLEILSNSDLRMCRVKQIRKEENVNVYNLTVEADSEKEHNYVVFTSEYTPLLISNCHAAIVARELGIACVVGTGNAMSVMKDNAIYTVNARAGLVYEGITEEAKPKMEVAPPTAVPTMIEAAVTGTKIYMNLGVPEKINEYAHLPFDGIGLMRIEFIIASYIYEHPNSLLEKAEHQKYIDKLAEGIATVARKIQPRPVVVRFSDFKTNEYRALKGGEKYEPVEANPMIGWRGCSRYVSEKFEGAFRLECRAVKKCRDEFGLTNVWVMLPFVRTTWEVERCLEIMKDEKLVRSPDFKVWLMAEVPSIVFMADEFSKLCDGFSIGSNDLTQLILGADRDSEILGKMGYFDERDPAVKRAIKSLIETSHKHGVSISICGQGPSVYPEFTEFLVECGIDSISINPDAVVQTRKLVASIETKIIMRRLGKLKEKLISP